MDELINRVFKIWAYTVSHSFLILRSPLKFPDQEGFDEKHSYNIDIEFSSVAYIDIPTVLNGIELRELINNIPEQLQQFKTNFGYRVFEIKTNRKYHYIVAGSYRIGKNTWIAEDRVLNMKLEYDSIIATS
jgi:hypothetical protein